MNFRDLSAYLRTRLSDLFGGSKIISSQHSDQEVERQFQALENIVKNVHQNAYPRANSVTSSGLTGEQCRHILSSEFLEFINEDDSKDRKSSK